VSTDRLVAIGEITRPHGLRGEVRVTPLTDRPERFARVTDCVLWDVTRDQRECRRITASRPHGRALVVALAGCESAEQASALVGRLLALPAADALPLPTGHFYRWQLEGCQVTTDEGDAIGTIVRVEESAAHDLWVVRGAAREHLIPAVSEIVVEVDLTARRVVIRPPQGLLEL